FLADCATGAGSLVLGTLGAKWGLAHAADPAAPGASGLDFKRSLANPLAPLPPQFPARARRVIYMHMVGGPSQLEVFDHRPALNRFHGTDCPARYLAGTRAAQGAPPKLLGSRFPFHQAGQSGAWISDRLPHLEKHVDDICFIKSMRSDQFNHASGQLLMQTG